MTLAKCANKAQSTEFLIQVNLPQILKLNKNYSSREDLLFCARRLSKTLPPTRSFLHLIFKMFNYKFLSSYLKKSKRNLTIPQKPFPTAVFSHTFLPLLHYGAIMLLELNFDEATFEKKKIRQMLLLEPPAGDYLFGSTMALSAFLRQEEEMFSVC